MSEFQEFVIQDRRLVILRLLEQCGGEANESVLNDGCHALGHARGVTRDVTREDLAWLKECGLVVTEWYGEKIVVAKITRRGVDVARGDVVVKGVKRPSIGVQ